MKLTRRVKRTLIDLCLRRLHEVDSPRFRQLFCTSIAPRLLDPAVLMPGLVPRPAHAFDVDVLCDPYLFVHAPYYWFGHFYEIELERYLLRHVHAGDTVLDVGMNVGHVAVPAARRVGPQGHVYGFEPNMHLARQVAQLAEREGLPQLRILPCGLGAEEADVVLRLDPGHPGGATFRSNGLDEAYRESLRCRVRPGDAVVAELPLSGTVFLKMDVEGFEIPALEGLRRTLPQVHHAVIEVSPDWLGPDGVARLFGLLAEAGLHAHRLTPAGDAGDALVPGDVVRQENVLFRRPPS